jgi:NAD(P)-dependent dehydrogenase (short-subunit alcohol dehydrogenase family)
MRNPDGSPALAEMAAREKLPLHVSRMDVDSDESVARAMAAIVQEHGPIDVLVNNAGIEKEGSVEELPLADFRSAMETNYFGAIRCIQAVAGAMRERRSGCIINVTSVAGRIACPPLAAYAASKWALEALSEALAGEMKRFGVRVAVVEPGIVDTAMARRIEEQPQNNAPYPQRMRFANLYQASLKDPVPPSVVAEKIVEIATSGTWRFRHPVGSDAQGFLQWRARMTDEEWAELNAADDETWYERFQSDFGVDTRPKN